MLRFCLHLRNYTPQDSTTACFSEEIEASIGALHEALQTSCDCEASLQTLIEVWPLLPADIRTQIIALAEGSLTGVLGFRRLPS